jgi:YidC/Oxa1 family membrane protein insertase
MDRRTLLALVLSFLLLTVYQAYMSMYTTPPATPQTVTQTMTQGTGGDTTGTPVVSPPAAAGETTVPISGPQASVNETLLASPQQLPAAVKEGATVSFENSVMRGKLSLTGGQLVDVQFLRHRDKPGKDSQPLQFFTTDSKKFLISEGGYLTRSGGASPTRNTVWKVVGPDHVQDRGTLRLMWENGSGLIFEKLYSIEPGSYQIKVEDRLVNQSSLPATAYHYAHLLRVQPQPLDGNAMMAEEFQGPTGFFNNVRIQHPYDELRRADVRSEATEGWVGFNDKYFLAAMVTPKDSMGKKFYLDYDNPVFRTGVVAPQQIVTPGSHQSSVVTLFVGPKEMGLLREQGLHLERAIDYGWFHFLAEPLLQVLNFFHQFVHNYGIAIILLTFLIRLLFYPLATKSFRSMNDMKKLQPKVEELKKHYGSDKQQFNQAVMKLYQDNKVNPLGGCLPILIQIPVFFALYKVLYLSVEMRHAPLMFWIEDLSAMDVYYVLPILMGISMLVQTKLNPAPADPVQAKVMLFLPLIFTVMFLSFPSGLVLYWLVSNVLSIAQQYYIIREHGK